MRKSLILSTRHALSKYPRLTLSFGVSGGAPICKQPLIRFNLEEARFTVVTLTDVTLRGLRRASQGKLFCCEFQGVSLLR